MSQLFSYESHQVRTVTENGEAWFAAIDVCKALGISWRGSTLNAIPDGWKGMRSFRTPSSGQRGGGIQTLRFISEPAVYKLAFRSNKSEADAFTNWVASEVLPAIRKSGGYKAGPRQEALEAQPRARVVSPSCNKELCTAASTLEAKTYACGKRFFDEVSKLRRDAENLREVLHLFARPGARDAVLPSEKQMLYDNANEAANVAVTSFNQTIYALRMIYNIRAHVSFSR